MPRRHRSHSTELERRVVAEYHAGETLHTLSRRHDLLSRALIRIWVEKAESGALDEDGAAAELLTADEARPGSPRSSGWSAGRRWRSTFQRGPCAPTLAEKRAYIRDHPAKTAVGGVDEATAIRR